MQVTDDVGPLQRIGTLSGICAPAFVYLDTPDCPPPYQQAMQIWADLVGLAWLDAVGTPPRS
jgi:hypothetical protein